MLSVVDFIQTSRDRYVEELKAYLAIPSISALPQHAADVRRCAEWTAAEMRRVGLEDVRLIETAGNPVVYGEWMQAADAPTILFYGHYDVQPVDPLDLWESPPFEATVRDGEIYARGAADDKGQVFMHFKAIEAYFRKAGRLPFETISADYSLEYGVNTLEIHRDAITPGQRVLIVDDLLATGGTVAATINLVEQLGGRITGIGVLAELTFLEGRKRLGAYDVHSLIAY